MPEAGCDYEVHHGDHTVQLRLVHGDAGVDGVLTCTVQSVQHNTIQYGVLTLLQPHGLVHTLDDGSRHLLVQVPWNALEMGVKLIWTTVTVTISGHLKYCIPQLLDVKRQVLLPVDNLIYLNTPVDLCDCPAMVSEVSET